MFPYIFLFYGSAYSDVYTLSLHDALPISAADDVDEAARGELLERGAGVPRLLVVLAERVRQAGVRVAAGVAAGEARQLGEDRKSTRLNSSHRCISYAVFCLKKKQQKRKNF